MTAAKTEHGLPTANRAPRFLADMAVKENTPLKFWEMDPGLTCPVVGMCLSLADQKQLLKKSGFQIKHLSLFEMHETLVASARSENRLSRKIDGLLSRKFGRAAGPLCKIGDRAFKAHFKAAFDAGDCAGVLWAAAVNPVLSAETRRELFGEIHMAMHACGDQHFKKQQKLNRQALENQRLRQCVSEAKQLRRAMQKENDRLKRGVAQLQAELVALRAKTNRRPAGVPCDPGAGRTGPGERNALLALLAIVTRQADEQQQDVVVLQKDNARLVSEIERQKAENRRIGNEAREIIDEVFSLNRCNASCPSFDLCRKRVLVVGGLTRMAYLYRDLIESSGGVFEYHDGYMKKGVRKLEGSLKRADLVVCPVNCNSHAACSLVKNLAKKHHKTVHMLASSSLSAVSQAIRGAPEEATIN